MVDYKEAFKRPFTNVLKLIIGIILSIIPIVNFIATGYHLECAKTAFTKKFRLPDWKNFGKLFLNGFLAVVISLIYLIPVIIILLIFGISIMKDWFQGGLTSPTQLINILADFRGIIFVGFLLFILAAYIIPMALVGFIEDGKFGDAFSKSIFKKAFTGKYFVVWILMGLYTIILGLILGFIPFVGGSIAGFITSLTSFTAIGEVYKKIQ